MNVPLHRFVNALSIRALLALGISTGVLILALSTSLGISWLSVRQAREDLHNQGLVLTRGLADQSRLALLYESPDNAREAVAALMAFPNVAALGIYDTTRRPLLERGKIDFAAPDTPGLTQAQLERDLPNAWVFLAPVRTGEQPTGTQASPFAPVPEPELIGYVRLVVSKDALGAITRDVFVSNLSITASIALALLAFLHWLTGRVIRPLRQLAAVMTQAEGGVRGLRAVLTGPRDVARMERAFNHMMDALEQREAALSQARDDALAAAKAKAQFAAHVSHEVRTPLNGLLGMMQLLRETPLSPRQTEYLAVADTSGQTLLAMVNDILDFSRNDAGKMTLEQRDFALRRHVEEVVAPLREVARRKGLRLRCEFDPGLPAAVVVGDPTRLAQVLTNLVGNAIKFTPEGSVTVRVERAPDQAGGALQFSVTDTGIGIAAEAQGRVFESFTQADASTTREFGGSGLGLTIARQLVELMGGKLGMESALGRGTRFFFTLHLPTGTAAAEAPVLAQRRILIAAIQGSAYEHLAETLGGLGATCRCLDSGGEALLEVARQTPPGAAYDALLIAPTLTDMDGLALLRYLRGHAARRHCRMVYLTDGPALPSIPEADAVMAMEGLAEHLVALLDMPRDRALPLARPRVLVAEDDAVSQMVARGLLEAAGCEVDTVADGTAALAAVCAREDYALVFMDCNMPGLDGYAATQEIRRQLAGRPLPIIAMTANTDAADVLQCREAGMDDHLSKPVQLAGISAMLSRWLPHPATSEAPLDLGDTPDLTHAAAPVLDLAALDELRGAMGARLNTVTAAFLGDGDTYLQELGQVLRRGDTGRGRELAHLLKGSARNIGALRLGDATQTLEEMLRSSAPEAALTLALRTLHEEFDAVRSALAPQDDETPAAALPPATAHLLIVDDDRSTRLALRGVLERDGYRITEAADGAEAVAVFRRARPDLVLMDAMLPVQDGFTACREITQSAEALRAPVLMITSLDDEVSVERAFRAGAADFIPKPINFGVLRRRVARLINARSSERHAARLAYHDTLTGLINRSALRERVAQVLAESPTGTLALLFLDLDQFKRVNDTLGHEAGDQLLVEVTHRLTAMLPPGNVLARIGSDEFAVLASATAQTAAQIAQQMHSALRAPFTLLGRELLPSASIGIALHPADGDDMETLLRHAETAATRAKEQGGAGYQFYQARMSTAIHDRMDLEQDLRQALEREQFLLFYQPQTHLRSGNVIGCEALLRWRHPRRGLVSPGEFIPLAEETGLITPIGEWVLREACAQARRWRERGLPPMRMAVNLSARQLAAPEIVDTVARALQDTGYDAQGLELEVTESVLLHDRSGAAELLRRLRALGVRISIDDFGTGYSSLGQLKHLPVDTLKIDRSFVGGLPEDAQDAAITGGILNLARSLKLEVVAEGVETGAQMRFLREHQCDIIQGYLIHPPAPASAFESWYAGRLKLARRPNS